MNLHVQKKYFDLIKSGEKIFEGRLGKEKYRTLKIGDAITFSTDGSDLILEKIITSIHIFSTFEMAGKFLGIANILPGIESCQKLVHIYREFYSAKDEEIYDVVMIGM